MDRVDCIVAGAGVVGLAIARDLALRGMEVLVLEREEAFGTGTSSRNSEVIHAGIYYEPGSLKQQLCLRGRELLYAFAAARDVPHRRSGKLIVATDPAQEPALAAVAAKAEAAGVPLRHLSGEEAMGLEPALFCTQALLSPETGIVDSHALMLALLGEAEAHGATLVTGTTVRAVRREGNAFIVTTEDESGLFELSAARFVNAAGLDASRLAQQIDGLADVPQTRFARGSYYALPGRPVFQRLIYPVPEPGGLGVHLTLDLGGAMRFGPDVEWIPEVDYRVNTERRAHFEAEIRKYWPGLPQDALSPTYCGIRPKIAGPGEAAADFRIDGPAAHGIPNLVTLYGIESPGLTSCLAIADNVAGQLG
ncbi:NAD(P)/FAD-dependent oxidoreductase [Haematobacter genomosp. 1]|uniref:FAD-dependent oxidoreductase n=1 Tax=Haematobacter genomosp. 1 TaxID=366618 RepID=A0A212A8J0_9RHOB|nr:NAD(P)/FAD-dependent oxidoreductase [Haematobacter genomosp. 1]OWJ76184.1 FAD-dependent oxidoreductase [Haematobacter genomosp. 1]